MLRLTKHENSTEPRLILEGRLMAPWAADVYFSWSELRQSHPGSQVVVDLRGVTRIDHDGENALALMKREGAKFLATGVSIKHMLKGLKARRQKPESSSASCARRSP